MIENLVPGSIWSRQSRKGTTSSRVIAVSNQGLSEETLLNFPQQVVFVTDRQKVLTQDINTFLAQRVFEGIDEQTETLVAAILNPAILENYEDEDEEETIDFDAVDVSEDLNKMLAEAIKADGEDAPSEDVPAEKKRVQVADIIEAQALAEQHNTGISPSYGSFPVYRNPDFTLKIENHPLAEKLQDACVSYSEAPFHTGDTLHTIRFVLSADLSLSQIGDAFRVSNQDAIESFSIVNSYEQATNVSIDGYVGTFLETGINSRTYGVLYVTSVGDFRAPKEETISAEELQLAISQELQATSQPAPEVTLNVIQQVTLDQPAVSLNVI
jgi:hypothetical protein